MRGTGRNFNWTLGSAALATSIVLAGCAGGYGSGDTSAPAGGETPSFKADTEGQRLLLERTQIRNAMDKKTQAPDVPAPASAAPSKCEGFPGFDRGCPGGGK